MKILEHIRKHEKTVIGTIFLLPFYFFFIFFIIYPIVYQLGLSFYSGTLANRKFAGLLNYITLLHDPLYIHTTYNTFIYVGLGVSIKMICALFLANFLNLKDFKGKKVIQGLVLLPWVIPIIPSLFSFRWMLDMDYGVINYMLRILGFPTAIPWLANYPLGLFIAIFWHIWRNLPFWTLIFLAGLQMIPLSIYDAAKIDGAEGLSLFRWITFPIIRRLFVLCLALSFIWTMGDFATIWVLTNGGPSDLTHVIATLGYRIGIIQGYFGLSSAMFSLWMPILIILAIIVLKQWRL